MLLTDGKNRSLALFFLHVHQFWQKLTQYFSWDQTTCVRPDGRHMGECNGEADHTQAVIDACEGEESCIYHGNNQVAGDPCRGIVKYTVINYSCV